MIGSGLSRMSFFFYGVWLPSLKNNRPHTLNVTGMSY